MKARTPWLAAAALVSGALVYGASSELADAAERQDIGAVRTLLARHAGVNAPQADGTTALLWAAHDNDPDMVRLLLKAGADPKIANQFGVSPLSEAAGLGNAALMKVLLDAGADAKTLTTPDGETVLMTAARSGNADAVRLLIEHGADVNAHENYKGQTALMWAAAERHTEVVKVLLEHGADWRVLSLAHETKIPKLSAASSVTPMPRGGLAAISFAAREGDTATTQVMLDAGVDINQVDADNTTPLVIALLNKHYTYAKFLLDHGADPNIQDALGRAALYAAIDMRNEDYSALPRRPSLDPMPSIDIIQALLAKGANPNATLTARIPGRSGMDAGDTTLDQGTTPLMRAARAGDAEVVRLLLQHGADPKLTTKDGNNALMFAAGIGYRDKNTTGTESEALEALKIAVAQGLDINQANKRGETALHGAASRGADTIVQYLVDHGAKLDATTKIGFTPLDVAMGKDSFFGLPVPRDSTVALLRKLGAPEGKAPPKPLAPAK
jgi:ankyrin repeat protein